MNERVDSFAAEHIFDPRNYKQQNSPPKAHHQVTEPIRQTYDLVELRRRLEEKMVLHGMVTGSARQDEDSEKWDSFHSTPERDEQEE